MLLASSAICSQLAGLASAGADSAINSARIVAVSAFILISLL
jgi:hypothetical protein